MPTAVIVLADGAGACKGIEIGPGFKEQYGKVRALMKRKGKKRIDCHNIDTGTLTVIGLRSSGRCEGKALALGKGYIGNGIGQAGFI